MMDSVGTNIRCKHCGLTRDKHPGGVHWSDAHDFVEKCSLEGSPMSNTAAKVLDAETLTKLRDSLHATKDEETRTGMVAQFQCKPDLVEALLTTLDAANDRGGRMADHLERFRDGYDERNRKAERTEKAEAELAELRKQLAEARSPVSRGKEW